ncbi:MAG: hypothetical protein SOW50_08670 [Lachnospiraceae bacterium]|nr:hypothetical protein [Lachnospiraceae bacterium]
MKTLWNMVNQIDVKNTWKNNLFLVLFILINMVLGACAWLLLGRLILPGTDWLLCFMGYPAIFVGLFGGVIYLYRNQFA